MFLSVKNLSKYLDRIEEFFIGMTLLFVTLLLFINVITRYSFGYSIKWAEELTRYLLIWVTFIGSSVCVRKDKHVGIDVLLAKCPTGMRWILKLIIAIIGFLFSVILAFYGWNITYSVILSGQLSPAMMLPMYLVYISIPVGGILMGMRYFQIIFAYLKNIMQKEKETSVINSSN
jgi:C4-dicarboxylate transporter, DctQ subunit